MIAYFDWEQDLIPLALQGIDESGAQLPRPAIEDALLQRAYLRCEQVTRTASKTFYMASGLLPGQKRRAIRALYAFCRVSDDLVDRDRERAGRRLEHWRERALHSGGQTGVPADETEMLVALAWEDTRRRYGVPTLYAEQLLDGVANDLGQVRYRTFSELAAYCYRVAGTVGLMSMHIVGHPGLAAISYAIRLGVALQLTNILRDVGEDWRMGRVYLVQEELEVYGISEDDIANGRVTESWRAFMRCQIERARLLYDSALPGVRMLHPDGRFAIGAAAELYRLILDEIEKNDYDVFSRRAAASAGGKLRRLPGIWRRARSGNYPEVQMLASGCNSFIRDRALVRQVGRSFLCWRE